MGMAEIKQMSGVLPVQTNYEREKQTMMKKTIFAAIVLAFSAPALSSDSPNPSATTSAPALKIVSGCNTCVLDSGASQALQDAYAKALGAPTYSGEIEVSITEFNARSGAARAFLGVLSGKDVIAATVTVNGQTVKVDDSARSSFCGIGCVAGNVGTKIAEAVTPDIVKANRQAAPGEF